MILLESVSIQTNLNVNHLHAFLHAFLSRIARSFAEFSEHIFCVAGQLKGESCRER